MEWVILISSQLTLVCRNITSYPFHCLETRRSEIEEAFRSFTNRKDIGIVMINQHICDDIRHVVREYTESGQVIPTVLEIPSVDHPYDPKKDSIMQRVLLFFGGNVSV